MFRRSCLLLLLTLPLHADESPRSLILSGDYQNNQLNNPVFVNGVVGWNDFFQAGFQGGSTVIANVEAGLVWTDHEAFNRPPASPSAYFTYTNPAAGSVNQLDYHATAVGHVLVGNGYTGLTPGGQNNYSTLGLGMAPEAKLISAGIATSFSSTDPGSFETSTASVITAYRSMFQGTNLPSGVSRPDVINSSWGGSGDAAATSFEAVALDGLAVQNRNVALVVSAGNGGTGEPVSSPAASFNNISVGSLGGTNFANPSGFSSSGLVDFYNPTENGGTLHQSVRAAVDIAAPGEGMVLAAYLGNSGTIGNAPALSGLVQTPPPTDQYFLNMDGTSFAAPIVAGGIALLKDVAKTDLFLNHNSNPDALDTRVIKSVLMAGSDRTNGWDNGQNALNVTTQALDLKTGAGAMNLTKSTDVYFFGTRDVPGTGGGLLENVGWDAATIFKGTTLEYIFASEFSEDMTLNVALNWFSVTEYDSLTDTAETLAFSDLNLEVWQLDALGQFTSRVGMSASLYNNTEFLRLSGLDAGRYGLRVTFGDTLFDTTNSVDREFFGLAWYAIPEPSTMSLVLGGFILWSTRRRRLAA